MQFLQKPVSKESAAARDSQRTQTMKRPNHMDFSAGLTQPRSVSAEPIHSGSPECGLAE
jgi:hypothetical protein